jgi:hypothetical protein
MAWPGRFAAIFRFPGSVRNEQLMSNHPVHVTTARLRFGMKPKSLVWAATGERMVRHHLYDLTLLSGKGRARYE